MEELIKNQLVKNFNTVFTKIIEILEIVPREELTTLVSGKYNLWRAYHIIEAIEYHIGEKPDDMNWGDRIGIDYNNKINVDEKIKSFTNEHFLNYINEISEKTTKFINIADLESKGNFDKFENTLDRILYYLRHSEWHLGEIYGLLKEQGYILKWK